jgi:hypothetical protein
MDQFAPISPTMRRLKAFLGVLLTVVLFVIGQLIWKAEDATRLPLTIIFAVLTVVLGGYAISRVWKTDRSS